MSDECAVIGYVRVSTDEQARTGVSLEAQEERIRIFCVAAGFSLAEVYRDGGESAESLDRPALNSARWRLQEPGISGVVVAKLDRLTRRLAGWLELLEDHFRPAIGKRLWTPAGEVDVSTAAGRFMVAIQVAMSEWELDTIQERTVAAVEHKRTKGERLGGTPYGWRVGADGRTLERADDEQTTIHLMRCWQADGHSLAQIADRLNFAPIATKNGGKWYPSTVRAILQRETIDARA